MFLAIFFEEKGNFEKETMRRIMRKMGMLTIFFCLFAMMVAGCKKEEKEERKTYEFIYDKLPKSDQKVSEEESEKIKKGVENWAKSVLLVDSSVSKENRKTIDNSFYQSIVDDKQREKVKKDRKTFYKDSEVHVQSTETEIKSAYATEYEGRKIGNVTCDVVLKGVKDGNAFSRTYHLKLAVSYQNDVASIYEIGSITWE